MDKLNKIMQEVAEEKLKARYVRRVVDSTEKITEPPWVTKQIRKEIKKRKELNRRKRNAETQEESNVLFAQYLKQKKHVQYLVKEKISIHEKKMTEEIKHSKNKGKFLWGKYRQTKKEGKEK